MNERAVIVFGSFDEPRPMAWLDPFAQVALNHFHFIEFHDHFKGTFLLGRLFIRGGSGSADRLSLYGDLTRKQILPLMFDNY